MAKSNAAEVEVQDDELELDLEKKVDEALEVVVLKEGEEPPKKKDEGVPVDVGIQKLKQDLEREKQEKLAAERRAQNAEEVSRSSKAEMEDAHLKLITNAITNIDNNIPMLKQKLREALAAQDADAMADIQAEIATEAVKKQRLEDGKEAYEQKQKEAKTTPQRQDDPLEVLAARLSPRSAQWLRAHPTFARDQNLFRKVLAAHNLAEADGLKADTDEYFAAIEETLKIKPPVIEKNQEEDDSALSEAAQAKKLRSSPPASAPVSRSPVNNSGQQPRRISLTSDEQEAAAASGLTNLEYAQQKARLIKEGKMN